MDKMKYIVRLLTVALLIATVAVKRDGKIIGKEISEWISTSIQNSDGSTEWMAEDGSRHISSVNIARDISGFAAPTPVVI